MNNAKMWLVVSPTVGVPIFLGAVAVGSFAVHLQVVKNTTWVSDFLQGSASAGATEEAAAKIDGTNLEAARASYSTVTPEGTEVTIIMPDGSTAQAIIKAPEKHVSYQADQLPKTITQ